MAMIKFLYKINKTYTIVWLISLVLMFVSIFKVEMVRASIYLAFAYMSFSVLMYKVEK